METIWNYTFNELNIKPENQPLLMSEAPLNPNSNREKMCETIFERFNVPAFYVSIAAVLALYASGRGNGIVLDSGEGTTHVVPVYQGYTFPHAVSRAGFSGCDLTDYMVRLLGERGYILSSSGQRETAREIKESLCYIESDSLRAQGSQFQRYVLPDGRAIDLGDECRKVPEALFNPQDMGINNTGIQHTILDAINRCDIDVRREFMANIILSGGNTLFKGFPERLQKEVEKASQTRNKVHVVSAPERDDFVWIGGSILASLSTFQSVWVTKQDYAEKGTTAIFKNDP
ncbi:actin [Fusarium torreyae]|uniref:Actin n=1 Tax=Fusarium torreyae TaxID=1237075 RepID=A0A9W8RRY4_9HYPO|nr:actin [Fusarium torreyae]